MAKQTINIGTAANDGTGDPLRTAFTKTNANFTEIYNAGLIPSQTGNNARYLSTDGAILSWAVPFSGSYNDLTNKPTIPETNTNTHGGSAAIVVGQQNATRDNLSIRIVDDAGSLQVQFKYSDATNNISFTAFGTANVFNGSTVLAANNTTWTTTHILSTVGSVATVVFSDISFHKIYRVTVIARNMPAVGIAGDAYCVIEELK
jgi:hypothetical protein